MNKIILSLFLLHSICLVKSQISSSNEWTWIGGSSAPQQYGIYGQKGVESPKNMPGARQFAVKWVDGSDNLWLFGGGGFAAITQGGLNDLWKYNTSTHILQVKNG